MTIKTNIHEPIRIFYQNKFPATNGIYVVLFKQLSNNKDLSRINFPENQVFSLTTPSSHYVYSNIDVYGMFTQPCYFKFVQWYANIMEDLS